MDDKIQKERLEQELKFLKESFEAEVISKEEFEKGKIRIEKKLKEIELAKTHPPEGAFLPDDKENAAIESKEGGKIKLKVIQEEAEEVNTENIGIKEQKEEEKEKEGKFLENKFFKYGTIFIILLLIVFFSYSLLKDSSVKSEGKMNKAINQVNKEIPKTNVIVLNARNDCFNCDAQRVLNILENWFGAINVKEIEYNTEEGKNLAEKFNANLLPMYILDEGITKNQNFEQIKQIFVKKDDNYVLSDDASGSTFYLKRDNVANKLDLFMISGDEASIKAEKNSEEFLRSFKEVKFDKHFSNDKLTEELGIKTFPVFLVNNKVKFSGVQPAETIKENFCRMNKVEVCEKKMWPISEPLLPSH